MPTYGARRPEICPYLPQAISVGLCEAMGLRWKSLTEELRTEWGAHGLDLAQGPGKMEEAPSGPSLRMSPRLDGHRR